MCNNRYKYDEEVMVYNVTNCPQSKKWWSKQSIEEETKGYTTKLQMISINYADNIAATSTYWSSTKEKPIRRKSLGKFIKLFLSLYLQTF